MSAPQPRPIDVWTLFLRAHASLYSRLEHELVEAHGLKMAWFDVLAQLDAAGGRLRMNELADRILFSASGLTRLVDRIERAELVERERCEDDRRCSWAILTDDGRDLLKRAQRTHFRGLRTHFLSRLRPDELPALDSAFRRLLAADAA